MMTRFNDNWFPTLFNDFFGNGVWVTNPRKSNVTAPSINVLDEEKEYKVEVAAPGMTKEDFQVKVDKDNNLVIALEKKTDEQTEGENKKYLRREFSYSKYQQAFTLPDDVEIGRISASMADGVLTIHIPKKAPEPVVDNARQIEIH